MNDKLKALKYQRWTIIWTLVILIFCTIRMPESKGPGFFFVGFDKVVHLGFFYVLSILLFYGKIMDQHNYSFRLLTILKIVVITFCLGAAIELIQWKFFPYRSAEWWDLGCDMIGVFMAVFSYIIIHKSNFNEKIDNNNNKESSTN